MLYFIYKFIYLCSFFYFMNKTYVIIRYLKYKVFAHNYKVYFSTAARPVSFQKILATNILHSCNLMGCCLGFCEVKRKKKQHLNSLINN